MLLKNVQTAARNGARIIVLMRVFIITEHVLTLVVNKEPALKDNYLKKKYLKNVYMAAKITRALIN